MGHDKASLRSGLRGDGPSFAQRTADALRTATRPALEVGPGFSDLPRVHEQQPGGGPLAALAAGATQLLRDDSIGAAVLLATDMPMLGPAAVAWLSAYPVAGTVIPVVDGSPQPLCARYDRNALQAAVTLVEAGARSMHELLSVVEHVIAGPEDLLAAGIDPASLRDVDTPADLSSYRSGRR